MRCLDSTMIVLPTGALLTALIASCDRYRRSRSQPRDGIGCCVLDS
jgi:hypothetical protein